MPKVISMDIEADGLQDDVTRAWIICVKEPGLAVRSYPPDKLKQGLAELESADVIACHNVINYDIPVLQRLYGLKLKDDVQIVDTYILSQLSKPDRSKPMGMKGKAGSHGLAAWGMRFGVPKPEHEDWSQYSEDMRVRCEVDTDITEKTYLQLCNECSLDYKNPLKEGAQWYRSMMLEQKFQLYINDIETNKCPVDANKMREHISFLYAERERLEEELLPDMPKIIKQYGVTVSEPFTMSGAYKKMVTDWLPDDHDCVVGPFTRIQYFDINLGSDKQVKEYLLSIGWRPTEWNYKKVTEKEARDPKSPFYKQRVGRDARDANGNQIKTSPKLTEDSFDSIGSDVGQKIAYYLRLSHRKSLLEGVLALERDGRVAQRFTGLTSTGRYKHAGIVNMPGTSWFGHEIRECFVTIAGYKMVGTDAASCQLRMLAHYMGDPDYVETVVSGIEVDESTGIYHGTDVHTTNGIACGLISEEDVKFCRGKSEADLKENHTELYALICLNRRKAKNFIYGFLFGAGPPKIAATIGCSVKEASAIMKRFTRSLPALGKLIRNLEKAYDTRGYLVGLDGRIIEIRSPHMKLVYLLQSAEAIYMKMAGCLIQGACKQKDLNNQLIIFSHDEFQELVPDDQVEEYVSIAKWAFKRAGEVLNLNCPMAGTPKVGVNWGETH